jgi:uncharacterized cupin superfamily protein
MGEITSTDGYSVASIDDLGEGPGFRKVRKNLGVEAFGVNAIILPAAYETKYHFHDRQEELYFVHSGEVEIEFGDGTIHRLSPGSFARVAASTRRKLRNVGDGEATYVCVGADGGYVGRDGRPGEA